MTDLLQMAIQLRRRDALRQYVCQEYILRRLHEDEMWYIEALIITQQLKVKYKFCSLELKEARFRAQDMCQT